MSCKRSLSGLQTGKHELPTVGMINLRWEITAEYIYSITKQEQLAQPTILLVVSPGFDNRLNHHTCTLRYQTGDKTVVRVNAKFCNSYSVFLPDSSGVLKFWYSAGKVILNEQRRHFNSPISRLLFVFSGPPSKMLVNFSVTKVEFCRSFMISGFMIYGWSVQ